MYTTLVNKMLFLKLIWLFSCLVLELILLFNSTPTQRTETLRPQWSFVLVSCPCILVDFLEMCLYKGIIRRELGILQNGNVLT
jgi:hypothetical protein